MMKITRTKLIPNETSVDSDCARGRCLLHETDVMNPLLEFVSQLFERIFYRTRTHWPVYANVSSECIENTSFQINLQVGKSVRLAGLNPAVSRIRN